MRRHNNECGSVTVEAACVLPLFMFAIITILSLVNICTAQARITAAVNASAKEISQYSYMYALTGFKGTHEGWANSGNASAGKVNQVVKTANDVFNAIEGLKEGGSDTHGADDTDALLARMQALLSSPGAIASSASELAAAFKEMVKNPRDLIFGLVKLVASNALNTAVSQYIAAPLSKHMCGKHLMNEENGDVEAYLKSLQIVPVNDSYLDGLDFSQSTLFADGDDRIVITCKYKIKPIMLLPIDFEFTFRSTAVTRIWPADQTLGEIFGK